MRLVRLTNDRIDYPALTLVTVLLSSVFLPSYLFLALSSSVSDISTNLRLQQTVLNLLPSSFFWNDKSKTRLL